LASKAKTTTWGSLLAIAIALLLQYLELLPQTGNATPPRPPEVSAPEPGVFTRGDSRIESLIRERRSGVMVDTMGVVVKKLRDDHEGSRHQRFLFELPSGNTLLVAHNIDLAPRVPLEEGDEVRVFGQYEWNEKGGVMHWTHHDPAGRHEEGFVEHRGRRYQ
jgi:hypothetical protein